MKRVFKPLLIICGPTTCLMPAPQSQQWGVSMTDTKAEAVENLSEVLRWIANEYALADSYASYTGRHEAAQTRKIAADRRLRDLVPAILATLATTETSLVPSWWRRCGTAPGPPSQHGRPAMSDVVERLLRKWPENDKTRFGYVNPDGPEAAFQSAAQATRIAELEAENARLREVLSGIAHESDCTWTRAVIRETLGGTHD
jgi:hypothetical protein